MPALRRICIQWPRFGPYHLARLGAAARYFEARGVELVALETAGTDATYAWRPEQDAVPFRRIQLFSDQPFEHLTPQAIHTAMTRQLEALRPDAVLINSYSFPDARACLAWCRRRRRIAVAMSDTKADDADRAGWREALKGLIIRQFDAALVGGQASRAYLEAFGLLPTHLFEGADVVDNAYFRQGADHVRRHPADAAHLPGLANTTPFFLAVSRFLPIKNLDVLLQAYARYRETAPQPWRLVLVGDGPARGTLEHLAARLGLADVTFAGFQQIEHLPAYYGRAGALVHPSLKETWGLVVNEALAAGLPVIASDRIGCAPDLLRGRPYARLFDPGDTDHLLQHLRDVSAPETDREVLRTHALATIAHWDLDRFAAGAWDAVQAGQARADRRFDLHARMLMATLRHASRSIHSFHAVAD